MVPQQHQERQGTPRGEWLLRGLAAALGELHERCVAARGASFRFADREWELLKKQLPLLERDTIEKRARSLLEKLGRHSELATSYERLLQSVSELASEDDASVWAPSPVEFGLLWQASGGSTATESALRSAFEEIVDDPSGSHYLLRYMSKDMFHHDDTARRGLLVQTVAAFETFLKVLLWSCRLYQATEEPGSQELLERAACLAREASDVVEGQRKGCGWWEHLSTTYQVDVRKLASAVWPVAFEALQRRNLFVHRDGVADPKYEQRLRGQDIEPEWAAGNRPVLPMRCEQDYLKRVVDALETLAAVTLVELLSRLEPPVPEEPLVELHPLLVYPALERGHWAEAYKMAERLLDLSGPGQKEDELWLNARLARVKLCGDDAECVNSVRDEVKSWQPTKQGAAIRLARAVLAGDVDGAIEAWDELEYDDPSRLLNEIQHWPVVGYGELTFRQFKAHVAVSVPQLQRRVATLARDPRPEATFPRKGSHKRPRYDR